MTYFLHLFWTIPGILEGLVQDGRDGRDAGILKQQINLSRQG